MNEYIKKEAEKLYKKVLKAYKANPDLTMSEILNSFLAEFNAAVGKKINKEIIELMSANFSGSTLIAGSVMTTPKLSKRLYHNAKQTAFAVKKVLEEHFKNGSTIEQIKTDLYDGYGYKELLPIKKTLPKYLTNDFDANKIARLKTKTLKAAYITVLNAKNDAKLKKALKVAVEEKARYYAQRIADTEESRNFNLINTKRQIDKGVKYVKWTLSSRHKVTCICDFFANHNVGYGAGIYPLMSAPVPVFSTHPHCMCYLKDYYRTPSLSKIENPIERTMSEFDNTEKRRIMGSENNLQRWKDGIPAIEIWNSMRPYHPQKKVGDLF